jgi:spore coat polysaccharide biosynthesis protein SpsF
VTGPTRGAAGAAGAAGRVLVVVQARAGSTRLPGKVLAEVHGMPMLGFQLRRLAPIADLVGGQVVVATSDLPGDDPVTAVGHGLGLDVVRGSEADVLGRFALALAAHPAEVVVRLTGDCPLTDPGIVADAVRLHLEAGAHYTSNVLPRSFPKGLDVEVVSAAALRAADAEAVDPGEREHVTPFLYRRPERFRLANLASGQALGEEWWTVDTPEDLDRVRSMVARLADPLGASWTDVLAVVGAHEPGPGEVVLRPAACPEPGSCPWVRRWTVEVDGRVVGEASVSVGHGRAERHLDVAEAWRTAAEAALDRLLTGDQQSAL